MTGKFYQKLAMRTSNGDLTNEEHLMNGVLGLCGEAGEAADIVKKYRMQGHELNKEHLALELGDVMWYIAETATAIGYDLDKIMSMNIDKLLKRYPERFDSAKSQNREKGDI